MEALEQCAYHESGKIVMAYLQGYFCESAELSATHADAGKTSINGGNDLPYIQMVLQPGFVVSEEHRDEAVRVARKLMHIYCIGACSTLYYENGKKFATDVEVKFPGQDFSQLELINSFLKKNNTNHTEEVLNGMLNRLLADFQRGAFSQPIEALVNRFMEAEEHKINRFQIEDTLKSVGFELAERKSTSGFSVSVSEDETPSKSTLTTSSSANPHSEEKEALLDAVLTKFLFSVNRELSTQEVDASIAFLKSVFAKSNQN